MIGLEIVWTWSDRFGVSQEAAGGADHGMLATDASLKRGPEGGIDFKNIFVTESGAAAGAAAQGLEVQSIQILRDEIVGLYPVITGVDLGVNAMNF